MNPSTAAEHVLTGAYWFQMIKSAENVTAHQVNNELKNLGSSPSNITDVFTDLINRKPALVRQGRQEWHVSAGSQEVQAHD